MSDAPAIVIPEGLMFGNWRAILAQDETIQLPRNASTQAYAKTLRVKAGAGVLFGFQGYSSNAGAQFIQVHDTRDVPATGAVPVIVINVAATTDFSAGFSTWGRWFTAGIWIVNSSTGPTYTAGVADTWFDAQYI